MRFYDFARLTRIEHSVMLALGVWLGQFLSSGVPSIELAVYGALPAFCIGLASFALNDFFDVEADRINKRMDRPLVSGDLSARQAVSTAILGFLFGVAFSVPLSLLARDFILFKIAVAYAFLAVLYSAKLKDLPLVGNLFIASSMSIAMIYGSLSVAPSLSSTILIVSAMAFLAGLAREIVKTVQDMEGDRKARKSRTLPIAIGSKYSIVFALVLYLLAIFLSFVPFLSIPPFKSNFLFLALVLACDVLLGYSSINLLRRRTKEALERARVWSLAGMMVGLLAFFLGTIVPV